MKEAIYRCWHHANIGHPLRGFNLTHSSKGTPTYWRVQCRENGSSFLPISRLCTFSIHIHNEHDISDTVTGLSLNNWIRNIYITCITSISRIRVLYALYIHFTCYLWWLLMRKKCCIDIPRINLFVKRWIPLGITFRFFCMFGWNNWCIQFSLMTIVHSFTDCLM